MKIENITKTPFSKFIGGVVSVALMVLLVGPQFAFAASLTAVKDTMSTQAPSATADHTITWTQAAGHSVAAGDTIAIAFTVSGDYTANAAASWQTTDFSYTDNVRTNQAPLAVGATPSCSAGTANYTVTISGTVLPVFTITTCSTWTTSSTGSAITFKIFGSSATGNGTLTNKSSNAESSTFTITNTGSNTDTGLGAVVVETNDIVTVSATVNPTLVLNISSPTVSLGTLSTGSAGTGTHTAQIATNAGGGFILTYNGATLTSGSNTIPAYGSQVSSVNGTAGFGINMVSNTTPSVGAAVTQNSGTCNALPADYGTTNKFSYVAGTTTSLTNQTQPADCTYTVSYVANISSTTPAGAYSTPITYIASGTF